MKWKYLAGAAILIILLFIFGRSKNTLVQPGGYNAASSTPIATRTAATPPPPQAKNYSLTFNEDFSKFDLSPDGKGKHTWYNPGIWWETAAPYDHIAVSNSTLTLAWVKGQTPKGDTSIGTAAPNGSYYHAWQYGYFEVRLKWENTTTGSWPGVWMIPVEGIRHAPDLGELDIMEGSGNNPANGYYATVHEWKNGQDVYDNNKTHLWTAPQGTDMSQYHTYGLLWVPGTVTWYFDNQKVFSYPTTPGIDANHYFIILGSQEGVEEQGVAPYGDTNGVSAQRINMQVQWVHVFQKG